MSVPQPPLNFGGGYGGGDTSTTPPELAPPVSESLPYDLPMGSPSQLRQRWPHGPPTDKDTQDFQDQGGRGLPSDEWLEQKRKEKPPPKFDPNQPVIINPRKSGGSILDRISEDWDDWNKQNKKKWDEWNKPGPDLIQDFGPGLPPGVDTSDGDSPPPDSDNSYQHGGEVGGWGSGTSDSVPIMASKGEYVVRADGSNLQNAVNYFRKGFAGGGHVDDEERHRRFRELVERAKQLREQNVARDGGEPDRFMPAHKASRPWWQDQPTGEESSVPAGTRMWHGGEVSDRVMKAARFVRGFAQGGFIGGDSFARSVATMPGYTNGGPVTSGATAGTSDPLSYHALDIKTEAGTFRASVTPDVMRALQSSALASKLSETGPRPSWYS